MTELKKGDIAPAFTLFDTDKKQVSLADYKGKNVVMLFFPLAYSSFCTEELCSVRDTMHEYNDANAAVIGISIDSLFVLDKFKKDEQLNFDLLSDFNKEVSNAYGVLYDVFPAFDYKGVSKRAAFVINTDGIVQYAEICPTPGHQPDFNAIVALLNAEY